MIFQGVRVCCFSWSSVTYTQGIVHLQLEIPRQGLWPSTSAAFFALVVFLREWRAMPAA